MSGFGSVMALGTLPQKLLAAGLGAALLAAGAYNIVQAVENHHLASANLNLDNQINDPNTGYVVRLTQARTNAETCKAAVVHQNTVIHAQSTEDAAVIAAVQTRYDAEHASRVKAEAGAAVILAHKPQGATLLDRILDVDAQLLGDLK